MKRIDLENHFYCQELLDAMTQLDPPMYEVETKTVHFFEDSEDGDFGITFLGPMLMDFADERLRVMDESNVDVAVLSISAGVELLPAGMQVEVARQVNDFLAEAIAAHPDRLLGSAVLPVNDPEAACAELERCVKELGFVGWYTSSNFGDHSPDEEQYLPIFKKAEELGVYVYLHPFYPKNERFRGYGARFTTAGLGFTVDTMITFTRLILSGLLDKCPNLTILLGHLGEAIPFLMERMDDRMGFIASSEVAAAMPRDPHFKNEHPISYYFEKGNILVTTSGNASYPAFECTRLAIGVDHILFATDYPMEFIDGIVGFINSLPITEEERQDIYGGNAMKYLDSIAKALS